VVDEEILACTERREPQKQEVARDYIWPGSFQYGILKCLGEQVTELLTPDATPSFFAALHELVQVCIPEEALTGYSR
jgi:hypothetical protein